MSDTSWHWCGSGWVRTVNNFRLRLIAYKEPQHSRNLLRENPTPEDYKDAEWSVTLVRMQEPKDGGPNWKYTFEAHRVGTEAVAKAFAETVAVRLGGI